MIFLLNHSINVRNDHYYTLLLFYVAHYRLFYGEYQPALASAVPKPREASTVHTVRPSNGHILKLMRNWKDVILFMLQISCILVNYISATKASCDHIFCTYCSYK